MNKNHNKRTYITYQMYLYKTENHTDPATQETTQPTAYTWTAARSKSERKENKIDAHLRIQ